MDICAALTAYSLFDNKPEALPVHIEEEECKGNRNFFNRDINPNSRMYVTNIEQQQQTIFIIECNQKTIFSEKLQYISQKYVTLQPNTFNE